MKSMKKSMVLTTVLMVVLLIVALSTATFAWYTAQSNATVSRTWISSAESSSASLVVDIAKAADKNATNTTVSITMNGNVDPAIYNNESWADTTVNVDDFKAKFITYTTDAAGRYASEKKTATVSTVSAVSAATDGTEIWVTNVGGVATQIKASVSIDPHYFVEIANVPDSLTGSEYTYDADTKEYTAVEAGAAKESGTKYYEQKDNSNLRVAVFVAGETGDYTYVEVFAPQGSTDVRYADYSSSGDAASVTEKKTPPTFSTVTAKTNDSVVLNASVASMEAVRVTFVAWYEGVTMNNALAGTTTSFTVTFDTAAVTA